MIDLHSHILPGIDDGARTIDESIELARRAAAIGVSAIAATPHVRDDHPTSPEEMELAVTALRVELEHSKIPVEVLRGGELSVERLAELSTEDLRRFGLGGNPEYLLVETPYDGWPVGLEQKILRLTEEGITPVLAHPERNPDVQADLERVGRLVRSGALVQVTADSLAGRRRSPTREAALGLIERGSAHLIASDLHGAHFPRSGLDRVAEHVPDRNLVRWLTRDVPAAIVDGGPIPPRPRSDPDHRRRRWWRTV